MSQTVSLDVEFDGDVDALADAIRRGVAFSYNGRPLPVPNVMVQGYRVIAVFAHRPLIIDLTDAMNKLQGCHSVRLQMNFVK